MLLWRCKSMDILFSCSVSWSWAHGSVSWEPTLPGFHMSSLLLIPLYLNRFACLLTLAFIYYFLTKCLNFMYPSTLKICHNPSGEFLLLFFWDLHSPVGRTALTGVGDFFLLLAASHSVSWATCELVPDQCLMKPSHERGLSWSLCSSGRSLKTQRWSSKCYLCSSD